MKQYHDLLNNIINQGSYKEAAREGMPGTYSLFGEQIKFDLQKGFPIQTTKKVSFHNIIVELLWFLRGDTNIKYLLDRNVNIWNEDSYNYYCKICDIQMKKKVAFDDFVLIVKGKEKYSDTVSNVYIPEGYRWGDCGYQYGQQWRNFGGDDLFLTKKGSDFSLGDGVDQITNVINGLIKNPFGRRHMVTVLDPVHENDLALYWCHGPFQFNVRKATLEQRLEEAKRRQISFHEGYHREYYIELCEHYNIPLYFLDLQLYQRSADVVLGVPYNISSYALLTHIIAKITNMIPGVFTHTFGDVHIYENHLNEAQEILSRDPEKYKFPELEISGIVSDCWGVTKELGFNSEILDMIFLEDFKLIGYESYLAVKAKLNTGLK